MRALRLWLTVTVLAATLLGCASTWQDFKGLVASPADAYRERARAFESSGELHQALLTWRVVAHLEKKDPEALEAIGKIEKSQQLAARRHYQEGLVFYNSGDDQKALQSFLITLRHQPTHKKALYYLKVRLQNRERDSYEVQPGDSFTRIASKIYNDPTKAYMIAYFNDFDPRKPLLIGTTLLLPELDSKYLQPKVDLRALIDKAQKAYKNKRYQRVYALVSKIEAEVPGHPKARRLADNAHFDEGNRLLKKKQYLAALKQFRQISQGFKGRDRAIANARAQIRQLAVDEKLKEAKVHLRANKWQSAFNVAEEILAHDPDNTQARILFSNAGYHLGKQFLDRGKIVEAAELLSRIDPAYEDTGELLSLARARMRAMAESHYRDGVKHFINEDLESAIKDWQSALALNPDHPKARQDIENAQRLLNKLKSLESTTTREAGNEE